MHRCPLPVVPLLAALLLAAPGCGTSAGDAHEIPVRVVFVARDSNANPVVVLEERRGTRQLVIWIGPAEAQSIAMATEGQRGPRPNTHDLARNVIKSMRGEVVRVVVTELKHSTYYASIELRALGREIEIDSRPSDAIAIALRADAPIFVHDTLFESSTEVDVVGPFDQPHPGEVPAAPRQIEWQRAPDAQRTGNSPATRAASI